MTTSSQTAWRGVQPKRPTSPRGTAGARRGRFALRTRFWNTLMDLIAPLGYEDETGFHYGTPIPKFDLKM